MHTPTYSCNKKASVVDCLPCIPVYNSNALQSALLTLSCLWLFSLFVQWKTFYNNFILIVCCAVHKTWDDGKFLQYDDINIKWKIITIMFLVLKPCITIVKLILIFCYLRLARWFSHYNSSVRTEQCSNCKVRNRFYLKLFDLRILQMHLSKTQ